MTNNINEKFKYLIQEAIQNYDEGFAKYIDYYIFQYCSTKKYIKNGNMYIDFYIKKKYLNDETPLLKDIKITRKKSKFLFKSYLFQYIGFKTIDNIWQWGWSKSNIDKINLNISKQIFDWAFTNNNIDPVTKNILLTSEQQISNNNHLIIFLSLSLYLSKYDLVYNNVVNDTTDYFVLKFIK